MTTTKRSPATKGCRPQNQPKEATTLPAATKARPAGEPTIVLAAVTGAHGIAGEVKLKLFADDVSVFKAFNDGALTLRSLRGNIARFAEVSDRTAAEALRGTQLTVPRSALPPLEEGEYYHADLLGLAAFSDDGETLGQVVAVENFGAGDVIEVERPTGKRFMVPMNEHAVPEWDGERIVIAAAFAAD
ncbi:ribosome maturation factor RimM [Sphingomonas dokdonensis]|uniref:Ribosome maturation factor RimM n=1 Tax=Sphingomonas dokdonensis TaxID=344880 RepID=A0A245ZHY6_9SPHN|nr:ribosome maturation factor RimM [Sphingomonas dokdonensis]